MKSPELVATLSRRGPNAERRAATREKILDAAVRSLSEDGYAQTTTVAVADLAGVARRQSIFIRDGLAALPAGRERFVGSVDVTWRAFQQPQSRALTEIIIATRHDAELARRIPGFAHNFEAGIARGAARFAE